MKLNAMIVHSHKKKMTKVLIIGANGITGRLICDQLRDSTKYTPVAMIRKQEQKEYFKKRNIKYCIGDLEKDFSSCFNNVQYAIFVAGSGSKTGPEKTISVDQEGAKKAIDYAVTNQLEKFIMLSSIGTYQPEQAGDLKHYIKAKKEADDYLRKSDINYSIVQPGGLTNKEEKGKIKVNKQLNEYGEISRADVAKILITCLEKQVAERASFEVIEGEETIQQALNIL